MFGWVMGSRARKAAGYTAPPATPAEAPAAPEPPKPYDPAEYKPFICASCHYFIGRREASGGKCWLLPGLTDVGVLGWCAEWTQFGDGKPNPRKLLIELEQQRKKPAEPAPAE